MDWSDAVKSAPGASAGIGQKGSQENAFFSLHESVLTALLQPCSTIFAAGVA
jgi:hypothetical protein